MHWARRGSHPHLYAAKLYRDATHVMETAALSRTDQLRRCNCAIKLANIACSYRHGVAMREDKTDGMGLLNPDVDAR